MTRTATIGASFPSIAWSPATRRAWTSRRRRRIRLCARSRRSAVARRRAERDARDRGLLADALLVGAPDGLVGVPPALAQALTLCAWAMGCVAVGGGGGAGTRSDAEDERNPRRKAFLPSGGNHAHAGTAGGKENRRRGENIDAADGDTGTDGAPRARQNQTVVPPTMPRDDAAAPDAAASARARGVSKPRGAAQGRARAAARLGLRPLERSFADEAAEAREAATGRVAATRAIALWARAPEYDDAFRDGGGGGGGGARGTSWRRARRTTTRRSGRRTSGRTATCATSFARCSPRSPSPWATPRRSRTRGRRGAAASARARGGERRRRVGGRRGGRRAGDPFGSRGNAERSGGSLDADSSARACPERGAGGLRRVRVGLGGDGGGGVRDPAPRAERTVSRRGARTIAGASRRRCRSRRSSGARGRGRRRGRSSRGTRGGTRGGSRRTRGGREERGERRERRTTRRRKRKAFYFRKYFLDSF